MKFRAFIFPREAGRVPVKALIPRCSVVTVAREPNEAGMVPFSAFDRSDNVDRWVRLDNDEGSVPRSRNELRLSLYTCWYGSLDVEARH
jgi:hypothetical protein